MRLAQKLSPFINVCLQFLVKLLMQFSIGLVILKYIFSILFQPLLNYITQAFYLTLFVKSSRMSDFSTIMIIIFPNFQCKNSILSMQQSAFCFKSLYRPLKDLFQCYQFFVFLYCIIKCLFKQLIIQFLFFQQSNQLFIRLSFPLSFLLFLHLMVDIPDQHVNFYSIFFLKILQDPFYFFVFTYDCIFHIREYDIVFLHLFALVLIKISLLDQISDKLIGASFRHILLVCQQLILRCRL